MKLICEELDNVEFICEASKTGKNYFIEGVFMQSEVKNRNGRVYPKEILQKEVKRYEQNYIKQNRAFGELGHPDGPTVNLERVSHMIQELKENGEGLRYKEIGDKITGLNERAQSLVSKHLEGKNAWDSPSAKKEFDAIQKKIEELRQVQSLKNDLKSNNQALINKITNKLYAKSAGVDPNIRVPKESIGGEMGFKEAMGIEVNKLIDKLK